MICQRLARGRSPDGFWRRLNFSRRDLRVNGFEALRDCGCCEPLDAFLRTSSKTDA
jgi:hypothetical protein